MDERRTAALAGARDDAALGAAGTAPPFGSWRYGARRWLPEATFVLAGNRAPVCVSDDLPSDPAVVVLNPGDEVTAESFTVFGGLLRPVAGGGAVPWPTATGRTKRALIRAVAGETERQVLTLHRA